MVTAPPPVKAAVLECPQCGASLTLRTFGWAESVACPACGSISTPETHRLLLTQKRAGTTIDTAQFALPLGARGVLDGSPWEIIGAQLRAITVDGIEYQWREYVLFHPVNGFRYLSEYGGHWSWIGPARGVPEEQGGAHPAVRWQGETFRHFQSARATTKAVFGEFPWEVRLGDVVATSDYVAPPRMLSAETAEGETTWSLGMYVEPSVLERAFGVRLRAPTGAFAHQPNPYRARLRRMAAVFWLALAALIAITLGLHALAQRKTVLTHDGEYRVAGVRFGVVNPDSASELPAFVTDTFVLGGHTSNVRIATRADVNNHWLYFSYALISLTTGEAWEFGREVSYYEGVDEGEAWSEGGRRDEVTLAAIPPGTYYLRVAVEGPKDPLPIPYRITVRRDVPSAFFPVLSLVLLVVPLLFTWLQSSSFETMRWAESDHAPASGGDDGDEGDDE